MRGVVFLGDRKLEVREFPDPTPGPRDVILEIKASGMCGSDLHNYRAPAQPAGAVTGGIRRQAGMIAGHEPCGIVAAVGTGVTEKEARIGQRVMDHHYDGCGNCKHCRAGWTQMCLEGTVVYGSGGHGGHARYMKVPVSTLVPLPDALSFVTGAAISCGTGTAWGALKPCVTCFLVWCGGVGSGEVGSGREDRLDRPAHVHGAGDVVDPHDPTAVRDAVRDRRRATRRGGRRSSRSSSSPRNRLFDADSSSV